MPQRIIHGPPGRVARFLYRIGSRITLLVAVAVILGVAGGSIIISETKRSLQEQILHDQAELTKAYGSAVQEYLDSSRQIIESTAGTQIMQTAPNPTAIDPALHGVPRLAESARRNLAGSVLASFPRFEGLVQLTPDGTQYWAEPYDQEQLTVSKDNFADREWYQTAIQTGKPAWGLPRLSVASQVPIMAVVTPIPGPDGHVSSLFFGVLRLSALTDMARSITPGGSGTLMLFDSAGRPLVYPDPQKVAQFQPVAAQVPLLDRALKGETGSFLYQGARPELGTILPLSVGGQVWYVIDTIPQAEALAGVNQLEASTIPVAVFCMLLLLGIGLLITRSITGPIAALGQQLRAMATHGLHPHAGGAGAEAETPGVAAPAAELEWLQDLFSDMRQAVVAREQMLRHMADHDPLTGLYNRRRFRAELERHLTEWSAAGALGAVLFIDMDNFKYVNDSLGHQAGDEMICHLAGLIRQSFPRGGLARLGGDEFAVVATLKSRAAADRLVNRFFERIRRQGVAIGGQTLHVTCSVGLAFYPDAGTSADQLLAHADIAMYQAKHEGRNRSATFTQGGPWQQEMACRLAWEGRIRDALRHDRFALYAQPIMELKSGQITHYELLLRMIAADGEVIAPAAFLPTAERFGLIREIDRWVVRHAIRLAAARAASGDGMPYAANLSAQAVGDEELLSIIRRELSAAALDPGLLVFEITETSAIADAGKAAAFMNALSGLGVSFAIDDFGAGFSSLGSLRTLPARFLKIDGSFIRELEKDPVSQELVRAMVAMARGLGMQTVAEMVGQAETVRVLSALGVEYAQGYFIGRPAPLAASAESASD